MSQFCVNTVVAKIVGSYVQPTDYSALVEEIGNQRYAALQLEGDQIPHWYAMLYTTPQCVIVQDVLLKVECTRFRVSKVPLSDWNNVFKHWIDEDHPRYVDCHSEYEEGMRSWGADV